MIICVHVFVCAYTDGSNSVFQEFIPHMAKQYGFQYELVQYKWPRWLHQQNEKQRIIWGYKILFLDVLFPLAVDKILFVDADQVCSHVTVQAVVHSAFVQIFVLSKGGICQLQRTC